MNFTSNGIGRKNGFRFEIKYSTWLDGEATEQPFYLFMERSAKKDEDRISTYTERSMRFRTEDEAKAFCEKVAAGEISLADVKAAEQKALNQHEAKLQTVAEEKVNVFLDKMAQLGINPVLVPEIVREYHRMDLGWDQKANTYFEHRMKELEDAPAPAKVITLGEHLKIYQNDIDVCLVDKDTGEHLLPAICYLSEEELADEEFGYDDWEKWALSLPLDHIQSWNGCPLAVVNTEFDWDQTCFLIGQNEFESAKWHHLFMRSELAGADFADRLAYLVEEKPFEKLFDGTCMTTCEPEDMETLVKMLSENEHVYFAPYPNYEEEYFAYTYHFNEKGRPILDDDVDIKLTEAGKGLTSSLDGKVCWAKYLAKQGRPEVDKDLQHDRNTGKEM